MKRKMLKFTRDVFRDGACIHAQGSLVEATDAFARHVRRGEAVEIEVEFEKGLSDEPSAKGKSAKARK